MSEPFIGEIKLFSGSYCPLGWAFCNGQILSISEHPALFSILNTNYGGNSHTTFALPDLRKRAPIHAEDSEGDLGKVSYIQGSSDAGGDTQSFLTLNYIIALEGVWPRKD